MGALPQTPPKNFLKKVLWNLKNFQKLNFCVGSIRKTLPGGEGLSLLFSAI